MRNSRSRLRVARVARADDLHAAADLDQDRPARDEGAQDQVREALVRHQQLAERRERHADHLAGVAHHRGQVRAAAAQQVELAKEAVGSVHRDHPVLAAVAAHDRHRTRVDDEEVVGLVAFAEEHVAAGDGEHLADLAQRGAALVAQPREGAVAIDGLLDAASERLTHCEREVTATLSGAQWPTP